MNIRVVGRIALAGGVLLGALSAPISADAKPHLTDAAIRQRIIKASIADYPGNCPCPYNSARNGSSCGRRSAYSRGGGYAPLCYASDVSKSDVQDYRQSYGQR